MAHIADHLSVEELGRRARTSADACAARHDQAIWLLAQGQPVSATAADTGFVPRWLEQLASRYNQFGPEALGDRRRRNGARARLLTPELLPDRASNRGRRSRHRLTGHRAGSAGASMDCRAGKEPARSERCIQGQAAEIANAATWAVPGLETLPTHYRPATLTSPTVSGGLRN